MRIFLGLTEVSGFFARLQSGFCEVGVEAVHVSLQAHRFDYSTATTQPIFVRLAQWAVTNRILKMRESRWLGAFWLIPVVVTRFFLFIWAVVRFDVFIMGAGSSFFGMRELPWLRLFGKTVIYTLHGTDARPPYVDGFFDPAHYGLQYSQSPISSSNLRHRADFFSEAHAIIAARRSQLVRKVERYSNHVLCAPNYAHFLSRPFVNFYAVGLPTILPFGFQMPQHNEDRGGKTRVLHAPSHLAGKGTDQIREVIASLQAKGLPIEYVEVSGRPNAEVFVEIAKCDLVVDQYFGDSPMAGFAAEAGLLGKPAVVGGYFATVARQEITEEFLPPSAFCLPEELGETLADLILNPDKRRQLGLEAQEYVTKNWAPASVAKRFIRLINNDAPCEWLIDPSTLGYLQGIGLSEGQVRANVSALIEFYGIDALGLAHKPKLEEGFVAFSKGTEA